MKNNIFWIAIVLIVSVVSFFLGLNFYNRLPDNLKESKSEVVRVGDRIAMKSDQRWKRCLLTPDGTIYFKDSLKSTDGGKTFITHKDIDVEAIIAQPEVAVLSVKDLFYAANGRAKNTTPGIFKMNAWRSADGLKTIQKEESVINVPEGPKRHFDNDQWNGLYFYRTILSMPDGSWLATMYGNFSADTIPPQGDDAKKECKFMMRTFIVTSSDKGHTWNYLSSVAIPHSGNPVGEGFVEPSVALLNDGRLLCIMRAGHHFPLYASWSSDNGKTWTPPLYTGLDRGCDPCLISLRDGRVALSWGRRYSEGWSQITDKGDQELFKYPGEGCTNLSISDNGGKTWTNTKIATNTGSCYSTIFEVEPNVIFCQIDRWCWRIMLKPRN